MKKNEQNLAATANQKCGTGTCNGLFVRCKLGWNWRFVFEETHRGSDVVTIVTQKLIWRSRHDFDIVISPYPYGDGCREDVVAESIREAIFDLHGDAQSSGVKVEELNGRDFDQLAIGAPIDSSVVRDFARSLGLIRRVMVDFVERDKEVTSHA